MGNKIETGTVDVAAALGDYGQGQTVRTRKIDLTGAPEAGSLWYEIGNPARIIEIIGLHIVDDDEYQLPLSVDITYRRQGLTDKGRPFPLCSSCVSSFTYKKMVIGGGDYKRPRFARVKEGKQ